MAKKRRRRTAGRRKSDSRLPGWLYLCFGLAIGLAVAAGIYVSDRRNPPVISPQREAATPAPQPAAQEPPAEAAEVAEEDDGFAFDFYDMLPKLDVEVVQDPAPSRAPAAQPRVVTPGIYILQAGSFTKRTDAERREGEMALLGVRAEIRQGEANGRAVYRVYTQPLTTPEDVNRVRDRLNANGIETLAKRVSD